MFKLDSYTFYTRLFPAVIAIAPALALAAMLIPWDRISLSHAIVTIAIAVLLMVFADIARRRGKAVEPWIVGRMGGLPSTTMLRHHDRTFDTATKARLHRFLSAKLKEPSPAPSEEERDQALADSFYVRGGTWLREHTRNQKDFSVLFAENVTYGFRRNIYGLRWPALSLNIAIVVGCIIAYFFHQPEKYGIDLRPVFVIAFLHAGYLAVFATESGVVDAAKTYARQLLLSSESPKLAEKVTTPRKPKSSA